MLNSADFGNKLNSELHFLLTASAAVFRLKANLKV